MQTETPKKNIKESLNPKQNTLDKEGRIRPDWLFSYWIFAWFVIYMLSKPAMKDSGMAKYVYNNMNPIYAYYAGITENILTLIYYIILRANSTVITNYIIMILLIKALPIYFLRKEKFNTPMNIMWTIIIFVIYIAYLYYEDTNIVDIYKRTFYLVKENKNRTPLFEAIEYVKSKLFSSKTAQ